jgi:glutamate formiminotransferase
MHRQLVECVPNFSEGRDAAIIDAIARSIAGVPDVVLLDRTADADHNRCVMTFVGPPAAVAEAALRAVEEAAALIDLTKQPGAHPRIGAADVVPFIPIEGVTLADCVGLAERVGHEIWNRLRIPVYFYEAAARRPERVHLENIRRGQFEALVAEMPTIAERRPDVGEAACHPTAGATAVGARKFLIAYNINLGTSDVGIAKRIAKTIRFSSGGFRHVKAMGVPLASRNLAQVSINLTDFERTPMHVVFEAVRREAERYGVQVVGSEIVGLVPKKALEISAEYFLRFENFKPALVLENRIAEALAAHSGLAEFLDTLAAPAAAPAGGVAAVAAAMAAALGARLAGLATQDSRRFEDDRRFFTEALHGAAHDPGSVAERVREMSARLEALPVPARCGSDVAVAKALAAAALA